jgi:two-component system OmpR family response regulator
MQRILIVDPDITTSSTLSPILRREGYQVRTAYDGRQALQAKRDFSPNLIMLDWMLPDMHGL